MTELVGLVALDAVLLGVGLALLYGSGLVRDRRSLLRFSGLALIVGWASVGVGVSFALMAGLSLVVWQVLLLAAGTSAAGLLLGTSVRAAALERAPLGRPAPVAIVAGAVLGLYGLALLLRAWFGGASTSWDAWAVWIPKAKSIVLFDGIDLGLGGFASFAHPYYPPLVPGMDAVTFRFMDSIDPSRLPLQEWILFAAFIGSLAGLLAGRVRPTILAPSLLAVALMPSFEHLVGSSLADYPLALLFGLAGLCGALWLLEGSPAYLAVTGVLIAGAALTKNEGLPLALLLAVVLALAALITRRRNPLLPAMLAPVGLLAVLPWKLWLSAHDLPQTTEFYYRDLFDPGYLNARLDRLGTALEEVPGYLLSPDRWLLAVPLVLVAAALVVGRRRGLALLAAGVVVAGFVGQTVIYWIGRPPIDWFIETSADRTLGTLAVFSASLLPLLLAEAFREPTGADA
jgi:hypothetical protein